MRLDQKVKHWQLYDMILPETAYIKVSVCEVSLVGVWLALQ